MTADVELLSLPEPVAQCTNETALALADAPRSLRNYVAALQAEIEALRAEFDESCATINKLTKLLTETAIVIKGPEPDATKWSYHDIPDGVRAIQARAERLAEALRLIESAKDRGFGIDYARGVAQSALLRDQEEGK